jgi:voltage-gated potassium channel Kch
MGGPVDHGSSSSTTRQPSGWFWLALGLAVATVILGILGHLSYEAPAPPDHPAGRPDFISAIYHTVQLLFFHGSHLEGHVPAALHWARVLGGIFFVLAGLLAFWKLFRSEWRLLRLQLPWRRDHVVICGLGDLGLRLALDGRKQGRFVVAIEKQGPTAPLDEARERGVLVLEGDACDPALLRRARVGRAEFLVAACPEDHTNVAIAASVGRLLSGSSDRRAPLVCRLLIRDEKTRALLAGHSTFPRGGAAYRVNFGDLDYCDTAARQALRRYPLDHRPIHADDATAVHLVVVGYGPMGRGLALHAARIGHFANEASRGIRLCITVVDRDPGGSWGEWEARLAQASAIDFQVIDPSGPDVVDKLAALAAAEDRLLTYAVCVQSRDAVGPDDQVNFRIGVALARLVADRSAQVLTFQRTSAGFAALFPAGGASSGLGTNLHPFGMVEEIFDWDVLLHETEDALARALHEDFRAQRENAGVPAAMNPPWEELSDDLKDSNRQAADHVGIKLRAAGYHDAPLERGRARIERFSAGETLLMAKMEHLRWCAERTLAGWTLGGPTDRDRRINQNLVPWDQLEPAEQQKDPEQVLAIPGALFRLGRGIYR